MSARKPPKQALAAATTTPAQSGSANSAAPVARTQNIIASLFQSYQKSTPPRHKIVDAFLIFNMVAGVLIFLDGVLNTFRTFPYAFDSWVAAFASTAGQFVLLASLRIQTTAAAKARLLPKSGNPDPTDAEFPKMSEQRAFIDFLFASVVLHFFVVNYLQ